MHIRGTCQLQENQLSPQIFLILGTLFVVAAAVSSGPPIPKSILMCRLDSRRKREHILFQHRVDVGSDSITDDYLLAFAQQHRGLFRDYTNLEVPDCARDPSKMKVTTIWDLIRVRQAGSLAVSAQVRALLSYCPAMEEKPEDFPQYGKRLINLIGFLETCPASVCRHEISLLLTG